MHGTLLRAFFIIYGVQQSLGGPAFHPPELEELLARIRSTCAKKLGLDEEMIDKFNVDTDVVTPEIKCYMKCFMLEGMWSEHDESVKFDHIHDTMHDEVRHVYIPMLEQCRDFPDGDSDCETTYNFFMCLHKADPKHFYLP